MQGRDKGDVMTYRGHVRDGQIQLDEAAALPEGATVNVQMVETSKPAIKSGRPARVRAFQPIEMPGDSLADDIIRDRR